jgi:hypothetical protein
MGMSQSVEQPTIEPLETVEEPESEPEEEEEPEQHEQFDWFLSWI